MVKVAAVEVEVVGVVVKVVWERVDGGGGGGSGRYKG